MKFTKAVYRKARSRAMNEVYSRADILEWAKDVHYRMVYDALQEWVDSRQRIEAARTEYFKALERVTKIVARGRREKGLWNL